MRKLLTVFGFACLTCLSASAQTQQPIRVNCGGPSYTDSSGKIWQADTGFYGGTPETVHTAINGTQDPTLYDDFRFNPTTYSFTVPNGQYQVNLYFAETTPSGEAVGGRVFNVSIQHQIVFSKLDIFAAAGANAALIKSATITVTNGEITVGFAYVSGLNPIISAIEIVPGVSGPSFSLNFKYPDGTPVAGEIDYTVSSSLLSFQGSQPLSNGTAQCVIFTNPSAMGISAQFTVNLSLKDSGGHTLWQMAVGMNPAQVNLAAVQSSALNVVVQKM